MNFMRYLCTVFYLYLKPPKSRKRLSINVLARKVMVENYRNT